MPSAADRREVGAVYGAGLAQGVALVTFPAASSILTTAGIALSTLYGVTVAVAAGVIAFALVPRSPHAIAGVPAGASRS